MVTGFSGEIAGAYATLQRENRSLGLPRGDLSDVTVKSPLVGLRWSRLAADGLGAGTPAAEVRVLAAFGPSHDEAQEADSLPARIQATGDGRFENFALIGRLPLGPRDSLEAGIEHRRHKITDLVNAGESYFQYSELRQLATERTDYALGVRHRVPGGEMAARLLLVGVWGDNSTARADLLSQGTLPGGALDVRVKRGAWSIGLFGQGAGGTVDRSDRYFPEFELNHATASAGLWAVGATVAVALPSAEVTATLVHDRSRLPWVAHAVLGEELRLFDGGFRPFSSTRETSLDVAVRLRAGPGVWPRLFLRVTQGTEAVRFEDSFGARPPVSLDVGRGQLFSFRQFLIGAGMEFGVGGARLSVPSGPDGGGRSDLPFTEHSPPDR